MAKDDFELVDLPEVANDPEIKKEDFVLQQADSTIHEQRFQTKPTTFWKDSLKRFSKNKSSVVAAYILGFLVLLAVFVPIFDPNDVSTAANSALKNLEPKLFDNGGFWDGTIKVTHIPVDKNNGNMPDPDLYLPGGIKDLVPEGEFYTNEATEFGVGGYVQFGYYGGYGAELAYLNSRNPASKSYPNEYRFEYDLATMDLSIDKFTVVSEEQLKAAEGEDQTIPQNFTLGLAGIDFVYIASELDEDDRPIEKEYSVPLVDLATTHDIGSDGGEAVINVNQRIQDAGVEKTSFNSFYFRIVVKGADGTTPEQHVCSLIKNLNFNITTDDEIAKSYFSADKVVTEYGTEINGISFNDAMEMIVRTDSVGLGAKNVINMGFWQIDSAIVNPKKIYLAKAEYASFTYDSYLATLGPREIDISSSDLEYYSRKRWINLDYEFDEDGHAVIFEFEKTQLGESMCPIIDDVLDPAKVKYEGNVGGHDIFSVKGTVMYYRYLDPYATSMPKYLFGTDSAGKDMFKYVFEGLRNSLLLGVFTFVVCFLFGLLWGSISGYFGGAVDLVMERLTDILSGVPWIVVMTLVILKTGKSDFGTFALALCLTGWIGTASTTRTQFYRFRGREYVLASRTLGASDARLITKHILPNAMGTIITGAVLMIPSVIFSEATISYLGLGFKNLSSLGVILSSNQSQLTNHPYQLLFPSAVIALVMISFNLFGNGLRDAINPSLKGEEE